VLLRILSAALLLTLCACDRAPISYPPPEQRPAVELPLSMVLEMKDPEAAIHYVKDFKPGDGWWRWTLQQPTVKILAYAAQNVSMVADFALYEPALKQTGPVELSFFVNDHLLDKVRYTTSGQHHFEKPVPATWMRTDVESTLSIAIDKLYTAPPDGEKFGFILSSLGFVHK
jgi:hypothetical protein